MKLGIAPPKALENPSDLDTAYTVLPTEGRDAGITSGVTSAQLLNGLPGKLGSVVRLTPNKPLSVSAGAVGVTVSIPLPQMSVGHIVGLCSQCQMVGVDALGIITGMSDNGSLRYRPSVQPPTEAVGADLLAGWGFKVEDAIGIAATCPQPATGCYLDPLPETLYDWAASAESPTTVVMPMHEVTIEGGSPAAATFASHGVHTESVAEWTVLVNAGEFGARGR